MNKQLVIFLVVVTAIVVALTQYHVSTPSPFDSEAFFGPKVVPEAADKKAGEKPLE